MAPQLQDLLAVVFDLCYYSHQQFDAVLEMETADIRWMHTKLANTKKKETDAMKKEAGK